MAADALSVADLPHSRAAAAADRQHAGLGGPGQRNLLVACPDEFDFLGSGDLVEGSDDEFPGGRVGGSLPRQVFRGSDDTDVAEAVEARLLALPARA